MTESERNIEKKIADAKEKSAYRIEVNYIYKVEFIQEAINWLRCLVHGLK